MKKEQRYTQENTENNYFEITHNYIFTFLPWLIKKARLMETSAGWGMQRTHTSVYQ